MASSDATDAMPGGCGRFSDIMSENWPLVRRERAKRLVEAPGERPRRLLHVEAKARVANPERRFVGNGRGL